MSATTKRFVLSTILCFTALNTVASDFLCLSYDRDDNENFTAIPRIKLAAKSNSKTFQEMSPESTAKLILESIITENKNVSIYVSSSQNNFFLDWHDTGALKNKDLITHGDNYFLLSQSNKKKNPDFLFYVKDPNIMMDLATISVKKKDEEKIFSECYQLTHDYDDTYTKKAFSHNKLDWKCGLAEFKNSKLVSDMKSCMKEKNPVWGAICGLVTKLSFKNDYYNFANSFYLSRDDITKCILDEIGDEVHIEQLKAINQDNIQKSQNPSLSKPEVNAEKK